MGMNSVSRRRLLELASVGVVAGAAGYSDNADTSKTTTSSSPGELTPTGTPFVVEIGVSTSAGVEGRLTLGSETHREVHGHRPET